MNPIQSGDANLEYVVHASGWTADIWKDIEGNKIQIQNAAVNCDEKF